ncbi:MAG TPA: hypothetical protein VGG43_14510 [Acidimicrobiales bacterium]
MADLEPTEVPVAALFDGVVGQPAAVAQLRASARQPVHAYLLHGPPGSGKREAVRGFAAALLCPQGGCGTCSTCRRALAGTHPDLVVMERSGASLSVDDARIIGTRAQRRPMEASRQVLVVTDIHLAILSAPALLKAVEEPPASTVFVLVADDLPPTLATIASRCVKVEFDPVPVDAVRTWLIGHGVSEDVARSVAGVSGGRLNRAKLLATDPGFAERVERWRSVPTRLDGTGAAACVVASELLKSADEVLGPLREQHAAEMAVLSERAEAAGAKGIPGRKEVEDQHKREERRWRTDELRTGLATLAAVYRDRLVTATDALPDSGSPGAEADSRTLVGDVDAIERAGEALIRNPNEGLLMEALMSRLSGLAS